MIFILNRECLAVEWYISSFVLANEWFWVISLVGIVLFSQLLEKDYSKGWLEINSIKKAEVKEEEVS